MLMRWVDAPDASHCTPPNTHQLLLPAPLLCLQGLADASVANPAFAAAVAPVTGGLTLLKTQLTGLQTALAGADAGLLAGLSGALGALGIGPGIGLPDIGGLVSSALGLIGQVVPALG